MLLDQMSIIDTITLRLVTTTLYRSGRVTAKYLRECVRSQFV